MFEIFRKLAWFFKMRWKTYALAISGLIACAILSAIIPLLIGNLVDVIASGRLTLPILTSQTGLLICIGLLMYALRYYWRTNLFTNSTLLEAILRNRLYDHFTKMDQTFYHKYRTGDLMAHATNDLNALKFVAGGGILTLTDSLSITIVTLFSMVVLIDWRLTLYTILPFPLLIFVAKYLGSWINRYHTEALKAFSNMNDQVQESIAGMKVIKSFGEEEENYQDFEESTQVVVDKNRQVNIVNAAYIPVINFITGISYVLTLIVGAQYVQSGRITIGQLIAYFSYLANMTWPLLAVGRLVNTMERGNASYDRVTDLLNQKPAVQNPSQGLKQLPFKSLDVEIRSFSYPGASQVALENISIHLKAGQTLGIVGKTGSGKSTLFSLLLRQYDLLPDQGYIHYDQQDIKSIDLPTLNQHVGYIAQNILLFSTSILDNIRFGRPTMTYEQAKAYARIADIHQDILDFPEGYETQVGERGVSLSGGQKQRISIARSLALETDILLIDDALSAVDARTETAILNNLKGMASDGIRLIASHRMSSIMHADQIIVLEGGKIVERGNHQELMATEGWYAKMYQQQQLEAKIQEGGKSHG